MKNTIQNIISFLLILILLVSSLQFSIYKMECLITGTSAISLSDFEDCNKKSNTGCSISESCCCFHQVDLNFDYQTNLTLKNSIKTPFIGINNFSETLKPTIIINVNFNQFTNLPPPSGIYLLKLVQVFRL